MNLKHLLLLALSGIASLAIGCAAPPVPAEGEGSTQSRILGGTEDTGHTSVALVRVFQTENMWSQCTGTLIAPNMILTAAHCAYDEQGKRLSAADVSFDSAPDQSIGQGAAGYLPGVIVPNPEWSPASNNGTLGGDVSVIVLDQPVTDREPMTIGNAPSVGETVEVVGYGNDQQSSTAAAGVGTKRHVTIPVTAVSSGEITAGSDDHGTCHGDSGGPVLAGDLVVGVVSYGDTDDCHGSSHFTRTDQVVDFLNEVADGANANQGPAAGNDTAGNDTAGNDTTQEPPANDSQSCSLVIQCVNGDCTCGAGANKGQECDGQMGTANSCSDVCAVCAGE